MSNMYVIKMNTNGLNEINAIHFGILSSKEILELSVCEVTSTKKMGAGSIYDTRMGAVDNKKCDTCGMDAMNCIFFVLVTSHTDNSRISLLDRMPK